MQSYKEENCPFCQHRLSPSATELSPRNLCCVCPRLYLPMSTWVPAPLHTMAQQWTHRHLLLWPWTTTAEAAASLRLAHREDNEGDTNTTPPARLCLGCKMHTEVCSGEIRPREGCGSSCLTSSRRTACLSAPVGAPLHTGHIQLAPAGWNTAAPGWSYECEQKGPKGGRGSSQLGKEPTASSRKPPGAFQLGLFLSKGLCYKAVWEKGGINAPKAAVKSTLQSSCSLCYLILILIGIFSLVLPGVLGSLCTCSSWDRQPQPARTRRWPCSPCWGQEESRHHTHTALTDIPFNATPSSAKCLQIANSLGDSKY